MKKYFYTHIVDFESVVMELDELGLHDHEKKHLAGLVDSSLHHTILDAILDQLDDKDKAVFLKHLESSEHDHIWELLNSKIENVEERIKKSADDLKNELHKDIKMAKRYKKKEE